MASSFLPPSVHGASPATLSVKSSFLGTPSTRLTRQCPFPTTTSSSKPSPTSPPPILRPSARFHLSELLSGRGLCNGEEGLQKLLEEGTPAAASPPSPAHESPPSSAVGVGEEGAFEKELLGLTGGFPGGEKGLERFIRDNPPPPKPDGKKKKKEEEEEAAGGGESWGSKKPRPPELPLLMPGMIVVVKNPSNPYHMYCGIVQRVTDDKAGVLFEGGNWDKLLTFRLDELERREKGPPMVNPKSAVLETLVDKS